MSFSPTPTHSSRRRLAFWFVVLFVLLAAWALRLYRLDYQDIWWDEARNIDVATRAFTRIATAPELDIQPPLYYYALHFWTQLAGASAFATRFLSVWFGMLTVALVYRLGWGLWVGSQARWSGLLALILAAVAPYALAEAQETRMYTVSWAILAGGMLALWWALKAPDGNLRHLLKRWAPFTLCLALALATHYATATILATWGLWLLIWALKSPRRWVRLLMLLGIGAATLLLLLPVLPIALRQIPGYDNPNLLLPDLRQYLGQLYRAFTFGEFVPEDVWSAGSWAWLALWLGGILLLVTDARKRAQTDWRRGSLLAVWLFGSLALFYLTLVLRSAFNPRYISFVLPPLWALTAWALLGWRRLWRPLPWLAVALLVGLSLPSLRADLYDPEHFREDASGVVAYLKANATPDDIILVDQRYPFGFYWERWNNDFYGVPPDQPADEAPAQYLFIDMTNDDDRRIDRRLTALAGHARRVYWLTWFESDMDPRGAVSALLDANGKRIDEQHFRGYTVQVWELDPPVEFSLGTSPQPLGIRFEPGVTLVEGDWPGQTSPTRGDNPALITLRWAVDGPTARPLKVSLRLKDGEGKTLAQDDRLLLSDRHLRTTAWHPGESALNVYSLQFPAQPGTYKLTLVVYDEETLEAVGLSDGSGIEPEIGTIQID